MRSSGKIAALAFLASLLLTFPAGPSAAEPPRITAGAAVLMEAGTGQVLYGKKAFDRREPASLTKILTAVLAIEYDHPQEIVTVSRRSASISVGQELGLLQGDRITLENLIKAALLHSANDSTVAIAQHIAGSEESFIGLMNGKALVLGALNSHFANTNGYHHPNHYTTAYDLARITRYALANEVFSSIVGSPRDTIYWADGKKSREVQNTNRLVRNKSYDGIIGVKTGSTIRAGNCLIATARRGDRTLIAVVLHSRNRYKDSVKLLDYGFSGVERVTLCGQSGDFGPAPVAGGVRESVRAVSDRAVEIYLDPDDRDRVDRRVILDKSLRAPVRAGQKVGEVIFSLRGDELARAGLVAAGEVEKQGLFHRLKNSF